ncbi:hypothetical protein PHISP_03383 [Aspergillus sp. HF37]|nr:hypothetical protein PHISP_03383 [Aspergillus sp. HF37]
MAASALPNNGLIDPSKHAEYPIVLGDRLSGKDPGPQPRLINIKYNHKSKSATARQQSTISRSSKGRDLYNLTIADKTTSTENTPTYSYEGSVDPQRGSAPEQTLALAFDPDRKAFVLEPVSAQLNFNLRSSPAKSGKQAVEHYTQLRTIQNEDHGAGESRAPAATTAADDGPPDESNPYDYRHFLPKTNGPNGKPTSGNATPYPQSEASWTNSPLTPSTKEPSSGLKPKPKPKPQANPLAQKKSATKPADKKPSPPPKPKPNPPAPGNGEKAAGSKSPASDTGTSALLSQKPAPSPGTNIIVDGDLIIDMGSPPPSRPAFKVNPAHFSSNNTPSNAGEDDEEMEDLRLPSPAGRSGHNAPTGRAETSQTAPPKRDEGEEDDELAAEMEAAFEQSAREEEEARSQQPRHALSDDESEVSEEE